MKIPTSIKMGSPGSFGVSQRAWAPVALGPPALPFRVSESDAGITTNRLRYLVRLMPKPDALKHQAQAANWFSRTDVARRIRFSAQQLGDTSKKLGYRHALRQE